MKVQIAHISGELVSLDEVTGVDLVHVDELHCRWEHVQPDLPPHFDVIGPREYGCDKILCARDTLFPATWVF